MQHYEDYERKRRNNRNSWKLHSINSSNYECNNVKIALSPRTTLFEVFKLAKARQTALYYRNGKEQQQTIEEEFEFAMILKEQNYFNQDMMEYYTTDHNKTQEYLKIKGDQPEMKTNIIIGAKSAGKEESDPIVIQLCTLVWKG